MTRKIFVGGFPFELTELELVQLISPYGEVSTVKIVRDRKTHICKGYAFLEMANEDAAENAVTALHGNRVGDRELTVRVVPEENKAIIVNTALQPTPVYRKVEKCPAPVKKKRPRL